MPKDYVDKGDPYQQHCTETTELLRKRLGLDDTKLLLTFQSRFGCDEWLQPYTDKTVERLAKEGVRESRSSRPASPPTAWRRWRKSRSENAEIFKHNGGENFAFIPCLNDSEPGMDVLRRSCCASCRAGSDPDRRSIFCSPRLSRP